MKTKLRFIEEFEPIRNTTIWWVERKFLWFWVMVDKTCTHEFEEAKIRWLRVRKIGFKKVRRVIESSDNGRGDSNG